MLKAKQLIQFLIDNKTFPRSVSAEQYGTDRRIYVSFPSLEMRKEAEKLMKKAGYKVRFDYWPGSAHSEITIGYYASKYDGTIELRNYNELKEMMKTNQFQVVA